MRPLPQRRSDPASVQLVPPAEWHALSSVRPNVLLVGAEALTDAIIEQLRPFFHRSTITWRQDDAPALPASGTLVLKDAATLSADRQMQLLEWLGSANGGAQVVAATPCAVFPLVEAGLFSEELYYRLNTVLLDFRA
jgi:hypothetical protein